MARRPAHRRARAAPPGDPRRGPADGRARRRPTSAGSSATRPATSAASAPARASRSSPRACSPAACSRTRSCPGVGLVVFDEVHERNLTTDLGLALTLDAAGDAAAGPAHRGDVGHRRHGAVRPPARHGRRSGARSSRAPGGCTRSTCAGCRGAATSASSRPSPRRSGGRWPRSPATCSCSCRASARSPASPTPSSAPSARTSTCTAWPARWRSEEQDLALAPSAAGPSPRRAGDRHRRDLAHRRGRARRRRQRAGPGPALRRRHRDDPADDGVDQPGLGRPARRAGRAGRARRRLPAVEPHGARHPPGPPGGRDHPGRPRRAGARAGGVGHAGRRAVVRRPATAEGPAPGASSCSARSGQSTAPGRSPRSAGGWSGSRSTPAWPG